MRYIKSVILSLLAIVATACHDTIHIHPDEGCASITITMDVKNSAPEIYTVIEYDGNNHTQYPAGDYIFPNSRADLKTSLQNFLLQSSVNLSQWDFRLVWEVYSGSRKDIQNGTAQLIQRDCTTLDYSLTFPAHTISFDAPAGHYTLLAWGDFVPKGSLDDYYYDTSDMNKLVSDLQLRRECLDNDQRDCFAQAFDFDVQPVSYEGEPQHFTTTLTRPQGRYVILASDYTTYIQLTDVPAEDNVVSLYYPSFINTGYSVVEQRPNDGDKGLSYSMSPRIYDFDEERMVCVGDDYSFVNGEVSYVSVDITVNNPNGDLLSSNGGIEIPLYADRLTVVIGKFLASSGGSGGISVDDGFEDEIVVPYAVDLPTN